MAYTGQDAEARRTLAPLAANGFADIPKNSVWADCLTAAAVAVVLLDEPDWAQALYALLRPYARLNVTGTGGSGLNGSVALYLGMLAATTGRWEAAAEHFDDALEAHARMGAKPFEAWTRCEHARMLLAQGDPHASRCRASTLAPRSACSTRARKGGTTGTPSAATITPSN